MAFVLEHIPQLAVCISLAYGLFAMITHLRDFIQLDIITIESTVFFISVLGAYFWGKQAAFREKQDERDEYVRRSYDWAKQSYQSSDFVQASIAAAQAIGGSRGLDKEFDSSAEYHVLALSLDQLHSDYATEAHDASARYARDRNPDKAAYLLNSVRAFGKKKNWEFAISRAQTGLYLIEQQPSVRFDAIQPDLDYATEFRIAKILATMEGTRGSKAFEVCKQDAIWIVQNSKCDENIRFAQAYLSIASNFKDISAKIMEDYFREGANQN